MPLTQRHEILSQKTRVLVRADNENFMFQLASFW